MSPVLWRQRDKRRPAGRIREDACKNMKEKSLRFGSALAIPAAVHWRTGGVLMRHIRGTALAVIVVGLLVTLTATRAQASTILNVQGTASGCFDCTASAL